MHETTAGRPSCRGCSSRGRSRLAIASRRKGDSVTPAHRAARSVESHRAATAIRGRGGCLLAIQGRTVGAVGLGAVARTGVEPCPQRVLALRLGRAPRHVCLVDQADPDAGDLSGDRAGHQDRPPLKTPARGSATWLAIRAPSARCAHRSPGLGSAKLTEGRSAPGWADIRLSSLTIGVCMVSIAFGDSSCELFGRTSHITAPRHHSRAATASGCRGLRLAPRYRESGPTRGPWS